MQERVGARTLKGLASLDQLRHGTAPTNVLPVHVPRRNAQTSDLVATVSGTRSGGGVDRPASACAENVVCRGRRTGVGDRCHGPGWGCGLTVLVECINRECDVDALRRVVLQPQATATACQV